MRCNISCISFFYKLVISLITMMLYIIQITIPVITPYNAHLPYTFAFLGSELHFSTHNTNPTIGIKNDKTLNNVVQSLFSSFVLYSVKVNFFKNINVIGTPIIAAKPYAIMLGP